MRRTIVCLCLAALLGGGCVAEELSLEGGSVEIGWEDVSVLVLRVLFDEPAGAIEGTRTWVVTDLARRFVDGVFAWQLHFSETQENVLVIPNDFLMTRSFSFEELGVEIVTHEPGRELTIRIPRSTLIPNLVVPSDIIEVHALWKQMPPIVTLSVPTLETLVAGAGGGGRSEDNASAPSAEPFPQRSAYTAGETIRHRFVSIDPETGVQDLWASATCEIILYENERLIIMRHFTIPKDPETGVFELTIETAGFVAAVYDLCIWISTNGSAVHKQVEIREP